MIRLLTKKPIGAFENLVWDELFSLSAAESNLVTFRQWKVQDTSLVIGYGEDAAKTVHIRACKDRGIPIIKRFTGGGTVLISEKSLNYSLIVPLSRANGWGDLVPSFQAINGIIVDALKDFQLTAKIEEDTDITVNSKKIAGSSQSRRWGVLCHHGTILIDSETENIEMLIKNPTKQPKYRNGRTHKDFLTSLKQESGEVDEKSFERRLLSRISRFLERRLKLVVVESQELTEQETDLNKTIQPITHIV